jgi:hypothetical protein
MIPSTSNVLNSLNIDFHYGLMIKSQQVLCTVTHFHAT